VRHTDEVPRLATEGDLDAMLDTIVAAYRKSRTRMDRPPGPMLQELRPHLEAQDLWVVGRPVTGLICLIAAEGSLLVEMAMTENVSL
jgi:hypothetical protein